MNVLNGITQDSAKLLAEKLTLSRENALLKPEIEHLRSQLSHQKDVLAEKLALERQLNALEVDLANEKRAAKNAANKHSHDDDTERELQKKIRDLEKQLAKGEQVAQGAKHDEETALPALEEELRELREKLADAERTIASERRTAASQVAKDEALDSPGISEELEQLRGELAEATKALGKKEAENERIRKEGEMAVAEAESRRLPLEEKIGSMKVRLRETREELKRCRADLQKAEEWVGDKPKLVAKAVAGTKRRANDISAEEASLHTPAARGEDRAKRAGKKGFAPAGVGEKSTFSITPFLNKTVNLSDASLKPQGENTVTNLSSVFQFRGADAAGAEGIPAVAEEPGPVVEAVKATTAREKKPRGRPATKALAETSLSNKNAPALRRQKAAPAKPAPKMATTDDGENEYNQILAQQSRSSEDTITHADVPPAKSEKAVRSNGTGTTRAQEVTTTVAAAQPEPKKKKRKLLGGAPKTLFDGDGDADDAKKAPAAAAAAPKRAVAKIGLGAPSVGTTRKAAFGSGVKNAFAGGTFSPLKRERRGVQASFLG